MLKRLKKLLGCSSRHKRFTREQVLDSLPSMFNRYHRRTLTAIANLTNWTTDEVLVLIFHSLDYRIVCGPSGTLYVSRNHKISA